MAVELKGAGRRRLVERRDSLLLAVHDCPQPELARAALEQPWLSCPGCQGNSNRVSLECR